MTLSPPPQPAEPLRNLGPNQWIKDELDRVIDDQLFSSAEKDEKAAPDVR